MTEANKEWASTIVVAFILGGAFIAMQHYAPVAVPFAVGYLFANTNRRIRALKGLIT